MLGLGTPASNGGLKAGDVLVQVELQMLMTSHWKANILGLNLVSEQCGSVTMALEGRRQALFAGELILSLIFLANSFASFGAQDRF